MDEVFYKTLVDGYQADAWWRKVVKQIDDNAALGEDAAVVPFVRGTADDYGAGTNGHQLIFHVNHTTG